MWLSHKQRKTTGGGGDWNFAELCIAGFVFGGDVLRLFHGHMDECLTIPEAGSDNEFKYDIAIL